MNHNLINNIRSLLGIIELDKDSQLYRDAIAIADFLETNNYKIAVFAPFNHGKSTLLNALLGNKTLPIDLIPTTGAAITVSYGSKLKTIITLKDGVKIEREGTKVLKEYAILDEDRRMREDVAEILVYCDLPWLKTGVEFLDLPGTNDREAQDNLVKDKLLSADLIVHVLDARQLMTLEERNNLQEWLHKRAIDNVIFVVNFLNLLTAEERQEVQNRLCFIAESFRSQLPPGISNLYCVDALPALRARLKGNVAAAQTTGLMELESALQNIVNCDRDKKDRKLPRTINIVRKLLEVGKEQKVKLETEINKDRQHQQEQVAVKQKAVKLIIDGFNRSLSEFQSWLYLPKLLTKYQVKIAIALQKGEFDLWQAKEFKPIVIEYQQNINSWLDKHRDFFNREPGEHLLISLPYAPEIKVTPVIVTKSPTSSGSKNIPPKLNNLLKTKVGKVVVDGANYVINKANLNNKNTSTETITEFKITSQAYADAAQEYLTQFSKNTFITLQGYEIDAIDYLNFTPETTPQKLTNVNYQLQLLSNLLSSLETELE